jgi:site-specific DNA-methyltransferase (adenine-specific)
MLRPLLEPGLDVFIRFNEGLSVLRKVTRVESGSSELDLELPPGRRFVEQVSGQRPFGLRTFFRGTDEKQSSDDVLILQRGGRAWGSRSEISEAVELVDRWKVFTSKSSSEHAGQADRDGRRRVLSLTGVLPPGSAVTETYVLLGTFDSEAEARNCLSYVVTRLFRFLILLRSSAQDVSRAAYSYVPLQDFSRPWTDEDLYAKYGLTDDEIAFIESLVRPMELDDA